MTDRKLAHYRPDIDGLRAVAVAVVVVYHAFPLLLPGGFVGVDVFFVISGYLISGIILGALGEGRFSFAHFYARRMRRIFPALAVVLAAVLIAGWFVLYADDYQRLGRHVAAGAAFASNFVLWRESSYFDHRRRAEAAAAPVVPRHRGTVLPGVAAAAGLCRTMAAWRRSSAESAGPAGDDAVDWHRVVPDRDLDGADRSHPGVLCAVDAILGAAGRRDAGVHRGGRRAPQLLAQVDRASMVPNVLAIAGALMIAAGVMLIDSTRVFPGLWVLLPVAGTFFLLVAGDRRWSIGAILSLRPVVWVGLISYPLYLWHWPLLSFARVMMTWHAAGPAQAGIGGRQRRARLADLSPDRMAGAFRIAPAARACRCSPQRWRPSSQSVSPLMASGGFIDRRINRNDAARLVDYYERMRRHGLRDGVSRGVRLHGLGHRARARGIGFVVHRARPRRAPYLLWGDSFAQALVARLREQLPPGTALAQVATSACAAAIDNFDMTVRDGAARRPTLRDGRHSATAALAGDPRAEWRAHRDRLAENRRARPRARRRTRLVVGPFPVVAAGPAGDRRRASPDRSRRVHAHRSRAEPVRRTIASWRRRFPACRT